MQRALIIKKEWLDKIFNNGKTIEMRSRNTSVRGKIGLIESGSGLVMGEADLLTSYGPIHELDFRLLIPLHQIEDVKIHKKWPYVWELRNIKKYENPIPYKHPKGAVIWVRLDKEPQDEISND